jgi:hypothetical protein
MVDNFQGYKGIVAKPPEKRRSYPGRPSNNLLVQELADMFLFDMEFDMIFLLMEHIVLH